MKNNKTKANVLSVIISLFFITTTLSVNVFAYDTNVDITDVVVPVDGESPTYTATVVGSDFVIFKETFDYVVDGITWYDLTEDSNISDTDTFIENHVYKVSVLIVPGDGGYWSLQTATINGEEAEVSEADDYYIVSYIFGESPEISADETADITITPPVAGNLPSYEAKIGNECFEIYDETYAYIYNGVTWYDLTIDSNIDSDDTFINGHLYRVTILIKKAEGVELELLKVTINGNNADFSLTEDDLGNPYYIAYLDFGEKPIDPDETINITIDEPVAGEAPSFNATIDNECFEFSAENSGYVYDGIAWFDDTFCSNMDKTDIFQEAHYYTVSFLVVKAEGVELELLHANVNGKEAEFYETDEYYLVSYQYYIETEKQIVTSVNIFHISEPASGYNFDYTATLSGTGYKTKDINNDITINGISWFDSTDEKYVKTTDVCTEGHDYTVIIQLEAKDGYILLPETVNINDKEVGFSYDGTDVTTEAYFEYIDPYIRSLELTDINIPVQGDAPDYTATTDSDKYTFANKNDVYFSEGIAWFDVTDGIYLEIGNDTFVGGHTYMIEIYLVPEDGFSFDLSSVTLNGERVSDIWGAGSRVVLYYTFEPCEAPTDISVSITAIGGRNDYAPKVELIDPDTNEVIYETEGQSVSDYTNYICRIDFVYPTQYIMRVTREGCAARNYNISISSSNCAFSADLFGEGDFNMDGVTDTLDYQGVVNLALEDSHVPTDTSAVADYKKALADICNDGVIDIVDCFYAERKINQ